MMEMNHERIDRLERSSVFAEGVGTGDNKSIGEMKDSNQAKMNIGLCLTVLIFSILSAVFYQSATPMVSGIAGSIALATFIALFVLLHREIHRYERRVAELQRTGSFLQAIVDNIPHMIFVKEAEELRYVLLNKAGESLLGFSSEDLTGKNDYSFFLKEEANFFTAKDRKVFEEKKCVDIPAEPIHTRYKGIRILHTTKVPIYDRSGNPLYLLGISVDITDQQR
jgi:PAS domain S-box-containing protein